MNNHYVMLVEILKLAAAEPEMQIKSMPDFVVVTDEIALNFDDVYLYKNELLREKVISNEIAGLLDMIDRKAELMSDNKVGWSIEELKDSHYWREIRKGFILQWVSTGFFLFCTISLYVFKWIWLAEHMGIVTNSILSGIIWFTVLIGKPFTLQYARDELP